MTISLSKDDILTFSSILWCEHCAEQAATGLYSGIRHFDDGSTLAYRTNLCGRCSNGKGFSGATKLTNHRSVSAKQRTLVWRWRRSLHD